MIKKIFDLGILAILFLVPVIGCNSLSPGCIIEDKVVAAASSAIVTNLSCTNAAQITSDLEAVIAPLNLCKTPTGSVANAFCPLVVSTVVNLAASKVPAAWGCSAVGSVGAASLDAALLTACEALPVSK